MLRIVSKIARSSYLFSMDGQTLELSLENYLVNVHEILSQTIRVNSYYKYLSYSGPASVLTAVKENPHWGMIRYMFFSNLFIELPKLFSDKSSQKFNLFKLLNNLRPGNAFAGLRFPIYKIDYHLSVLTNYAQATKLIEKLRDKNYAHRDANQILEIDSSLFEDVDALLDEAKKILLVVGHRIGMVFPGYGHLTRVNDLGKFIVFEDR